MRKGFCSESPSGVPPALADSARGWSVVGAAVVALCLGPSLILVLSFGVFVQAWQADFGWPAARIALGGSIIAVMIMLISPLQGWLADRLGPRRLALFFLPVWAVGLAAMAALPPSLPLFYLSCALLPVFGLGLWPLVHMKIVATWFERRLGLALGLTNTGLGVGAIFLPMLLHAIISGASWRAAFLALAASVLLIVLPIVFLGLRERPRVAMLEEGAVSQLDGLDLGEAVRTSSFRIALAAFLMLGTLSGGLLINFSAIYVDAGGTVAMAAAAQSAIGVGSVAGRIIAGWLLDRVAVRWIGIAVSLIGATACVALANPMAMSFALPAAILLGMVLGAEFDILGVLIRRYQGMRSFGRLYGLIFSAFQLGSAIGVAGIALSRSALGGYQSGLLVLVAASLGVGLLFYVLGPYRFPAHTETPSATPVLKREVV
jgi:MFS family permease